MVLCIKVAHRGERGGRKTINFTPPLPAHICCWGDGTLIQRGALKALEIALRSMADRMLSVLWEGTGEFLCWPSLWLIEPVLFSLTWGDDPVLVRQAGPAWCGAGHAGGSPGGRRCRTDPWQKGGRVVLLRRIWPIFCFGQVSATTFTLSQRKAFIFQCMSHLKTQVQTFKLISRDIKGLFAWKICATV